ncbi:MAG: DMT family transporter [Candidatus Micrarchaeaceae archaeon]
MLNPGVIFGIVALLGYGIGDYIEALVARKIGALIAAFWSYVFSAIFSLLILLIFFSNFYISLFNLALLVSAGLFGAIAYFTFFKGFEKGEIAIVSPLSNSFPIVTVLLGIIFLTEPLFLSSYIGIFLVIFGTIFMSIKNSKHINAVSLSLKCGIATMLSFGLMLFFISIAAPASGWIIPIVIIELIGLIIYAPILVAKGKFTFPSHSALPLIVQSIIIMTAFFAVSYGEYLNYSLVVVPISSAAPMITVFLAFIIAKEKISRQHLIGIAAILLGIIFLGL